MKYSKRLEIEVEGLSQVSLMFDKIQMLGERGIWVENFGLTVFNGLKKEGYNIKPINKVYYDEKDTMIVTFAFVKEEN